MKTKLFISIVTALFLFSVNLSAINISAENARKISLKIWKNECAGSIQGLTCWNQGENFASLGIGHFIWYPTEKKEGFQESFPELLTFLENQGIALPLCIKSKPRCLWSSREKFYQQFNSPQMEELRNFLFDTKDLQAIYIAQRLEKALPGMIKDLPNNEKERINQVFLQLEEIPNGLYALIDYLNFKGSGSVPSETYNGKGWGLLQVLQGIPHSSKNPLADFAASAKEVLTQRVSNSPSERNEKRWLKGWLNRIDTYLE